MGLVSCCYTSHTDESLPKTHNHLMSKDIMTIELSINHRCERCGKFLQKDSLHRKCCDDFYSPKRFSFGRIGYFSTYSDLSKD